MRSFFFARKGTERILKLYEVINLANKKEVVKTQRLYDLKRYYLSMYRHYMVQMYDNSFIDDPTRFDKKQIIRNIVEMGISGLQDISGKIQLTPEYVRYAIHKNKNNDVDIKIFLDILYNIVKYQSYSMDIDNFYDSHDFENTSKQKVSMNLKMSGPLVSEKEAYHFSKAIVNCFLSPGKTAEEVSLNPYIWDIAMEILGIDKSDWNAHGLFVEGLSHNEEVECANLIFEGKVELNGKYGDLLLNWLKNHKWLEKGMSMTRKGLFDYTFGSCSDKIYEGFNSIFSKILDEGYRVVAVCGSTVYYEKPLEKVKFPIGYFVVESGYEDTIMYSGNALNGYTGEVYSRDFLVEEGILYSGCPIELNTSLREKKLYYDLEQVGISCDSWFKSSGIEWEFDERSPYEFTKYEKGSLEYRIYDLYKRAQFGDPVGLLPYSPNIEGAKKNVMKCI